MADAATSFDGVCLATIEASAARRYEKTFEIRSRTGALRARRAFCAAPSVGGDRRDPRATYSRTAYYARCLKNGKRTQREREAEARELNLPKQSHRAQRGSLSSAICENEFTAKMRGL
jgi:hypothetical protein